MHPAQCRQKGSAALLLLIAVPVTFLILAFYFFRLQPNTPSKNALVSPQKEESLKKDEIYKGGDFQFSFPKRYTVKEDNEEEYNKRGNGDYRKNFRAYVGYDPGEFLEAVVVLDKDKLYKTSPFSLWVFKNGKNESIENWFDKYWYYPFLWGVFDYSSKGHVKPDTEATISGHEAMSKTVTYQEGSPQYLYVSKDRKMYLFRIIGEEGERILSLFKF